jgi:hypothetical protein
LEDEVAPEMMNWAASLAGGGGINLPLDAVVPRLQIEREREFSEVEDDQRNEIFVQLEVLLFCSFFPFIRKRLQSWFRGHRHSPYKIAPSHDLELGPQRSYFYATT